MTITAAIVLAIAVLGFEWLNMFGYMLIAACVTILLGFSWASALAMAGLAFFGIKLILTVFNVYRQIALQIKLYKPNVEQPKPETKGTGQYL